jgi:KDO2-lipid IV(A) lauroyltransferase
MAKPRSRVADYAVYLVVRLVVCLAQALSPQAARALGGVLAALAHRLDRRHRLAAADNLRHAFPERFATSDPDPFVRGVYRHFCQVLMEMIQLPRRLHLENWRRHLELPDGRRLVEALLSGRPLLFVTGHFGNWELAGYMLAMLGVRAHAVARPLDNPFVDDFLRRFRERTGQQLLAKRGDFDRMRTILDEGGVLATLADQDAGQRGLFVDFFGRPASTHKAPALLCLEHRVPILVAGCRRVGEPLRYQVVIEEVIFPEEYDGQPDAIRRVTERYTAALERVIRTAPEQYFWLHRRWKHQPTKSRRQAA